MADEYVAPDPTARTPEQIAEDARRMKRAEEIANAGRPSPEGTEAPEAPKAPKNKK
jgi:hypothetical protein